MKRLNPETGKPFRRGEVRDDGYVFSSYETRRPLRKDGTFTEGWLSPEAFAKRVETARRLNRENGYRNPHKAKDRALRRRYGITLTDHQRMFAAQAGRCWICERTEDVVGVLHVDHCHSTGVVRGLLCFSCNSTLGKLEALGPLETVAARFVKYASHRPAQIILNCGES